MTASHPLHVEVDQATSARDVDSSVKTRLLMAAFGFGCFVLGVASVSLVLPSASHAKAQQQSAHHDLAYTPLVAPFRASLQNARISSRPSMSWRTGAQSAYNPMNRPPAGRGSKRTSLAMSASGSGGSPRANGQSAHNAMNRPPAPRGSQRTSVAMSASGSGSFDIAYKAATVQAAWDNHFEAFGAQDVAKIMLDYNEDSVLKALDHTTGHLNTLKGMAEIQGFFEGLFEMLSDTSGLAAPVIEVSEAPKQVYLVWSCPTSGVVSATDTFLFDADNKISRQNIAFTSGPPGPAPELQPAADDSDTALAEALEPNTAYKAATVQAAWDNHFEAFGGQNVAKIMLDYNEESVLKAFNHATGKLDTRKGMAEIQNFFEGLFGVLKDTSGLAAPVIEVTEAPNKQVYLVWSCPTSGITSATDTFIFDSNNKIARQNIAFSTAA